MIQMAGVKDVKMKEMKVRLPAELALWVKQQRIRGSTHSSTVALALTMARDEQACLDRFERSLRAAAR